MEWTRLVLTIAKLQLIYTYLLLFYHERTSTRYIYIHQKAYTPDIAPHNKPDTDELRELYSLVLQCFGCNSTLIECHKDLPQLEIFIVELNKSLESTHVIVA